MMNEIPLNSWWIIKNDRKCRRGLYVIGFVEDGVILHWTDISKGIKAAVLGVPPIEWTTKCINPTLWPGNPVVIMPIARFLATWRITRKKHG